MSVIDDLDARIRACRTCAERFSETVTAHRPNPVLTLSARAPVAIFSQAPGARAHASTVPFDDPSGNRLRSWLGIGRAEFYDPRRLAILPMAFCFPGYDAKGSDLPPPRICARQWREEALAAMPQLSVRLLIGGYSQRWHLGAEGVRGGVTETVRRWRDHPEGYFALPHPSWRNTAWLKRNPWFEEEILPEIRTRVHAAWEAAGLPPVPRDAMERPE
ncbi:MAG: uracil-DNA glycosylase family protein [Rubricella sp.]